MLDIGRDLYMHTMNPEGLALALYDALADLADLKNSGVSLVAVDFRKTEVEADLVALFNAFLAQTPEVREDITQMLNGYNLTPDERLAEYRDELVSSL